MIFLWNQWNIEHIGRHGVSPDEARYVVEHASARYPERIGRNKYRVRGRTQQGRHLQVIFIRLGDEQVDIEMLELIEKVLFETGQQVLYVIHARDYAPPPRRRR